MVAEENNESKKLRNERIGGKILAGALYIVTVFLVQGFLWQSIMSFMPLQLSFAACGLQVYFLRGTQMGFI